MLLISFDFREDINGLSRSKLDLSPKLDVWENCTCFWTSLEDKFSQKNNCRFPIQKEFRAFQGGKNKATLWRKYMTYYWWQKVFIRCSWMVLWFSMFVLHSTEGVQSFTCFGVFTLYTFTIHFRDKLTKVLNTHLVSDSGHLISRGWGHLFSQTSPVWLWLILLGGWRLNVCWCDHKWWDSVIGLNKCRNILHLSSCCTQLISQLTVGSISLSQITKSFFRRGIMCYPMTKHVKGETHLIIAIKQIFFLWTSTLEMVSKSGNHAWASQLFSSERLHREGKKRTIEFYAMFIKVILIRENWPNLTDGMKS